MISKIKKYRGLVIDELKSLETKKTKFYLTYEKAHVQAEQLCKHTMRNRGKIEVEEIKD